MCFYIFLKDIYIFLNVYIFKNFYLVLNFCLQILVCIFRQTFPLHKADVFAGHDTFPQPLTGLNESKSC